MAGGVPLVTTETFKYDYHSGANVGLYIGGHHITDAVGFEVSLMQTKQPVYGYASSLYDGVASGVVQVSGIIYMNFKQAQLMSSIVAQHRGFVDPNQIVDRANSLDINQPNNLLDTLVSAEKNSDILKRTYWDTDDGEGVNGTNVSIDSANNWMPFARPDQHIHGFDIMVTYGVPFFIPSDRNGTARKVKGVHIIGFGQTIQVDGEPVIESYPFIAREFI